jgi:hypothetical protein
MSNLQFVKLDTEIMDLYEYLTGQKKEGLFNFRSKNIIKNDAFKKFLQKLVDRLIDLKGYCKKYRIELYFEYYYFDGLLFLFNNMIEKNIELKIHIDILYDLKKYIYINYFKFLNYSYEFYIEEFKKFIRRKESPYQIDSREFKSLFESFIKSLSNKSQPTNIVFIDNLHLPGSTPPNYKIFIEKYNNYIYYIGIVKNLINQVKKNPNTVNNNSLNKLNKDIEKNIEQLKQNIELLNQKLEEQIKANVNNQKRRKENRIRISIEAKEAERARRNKPPSKSDLNRTSMYFKGNQKLEEHIKANVNNQKRISIEAEEVERERRKNPTSEPVLNWKSMYFKGNQYNPPEELPTDPVEIEKAKNRFDRLLKKKRLKQIANSCNLHNYRTYYTYTNQEYKKCREAKIEFNKMEKENNPSYQRELEKNRLKKIAEQCSYNNHTYTKEEYNKCSNAKKKLNKMNQENLQIQELKDRQR